ncbi:MAG TPA: glycoside hydrolase family 3 N-terminal domain-containing protein [Solirubrobacteraceae bacterium]
MRVRAAALAAVALALAACGAKDESGRRATAPKAPGGAKRAGSPAARPAPRLTDAQLAGQHVVFPFAGRTPPRALLARIRRGEAAGVIFLGANLGTPAQVRALTRSLRRVPRVSIPATLRAPLLLMVDQEGGSVQRLPGAPSRSAPAMAATGRPSVALAEGRATAATLRAAGMNVDLAPVVDVVRPESALQAEGRGFGFSVKRAERFGAAFTRGLRAGGVVATAKHFPGFGAAPANTDLGAVRIRVGLRELRAVDRPPFAAAIRAGAGLVMVSSAIYPTLSRAPAVLSARVVRGELREGLGFKGVTISDDLEAPAFASRGGASGAALAATRAGVDLLLFAGTYEGADRAARALADGLRSGRVDRGALEASLGRVLALRAALP